MYNLDCSRIEQLKNWAIAKTTNLILVTRKAGDIHAQR